LARDQWVEIERIQALFVRQSFASEHSDQRICADAYGRPWTGGRGLGNRRSVNTERLLEALRFVERRGRDLNPRGACRRLAIFGTDMNMPICRDLVSRSPVYSPFSRSSRRTGLPT